MFNKTKYSIHFSTNLYLNIKIKANEFHELERKLYAECKAQEGASDDDIKKILNRDVPLPTNRNARCAIACRFEKMGAVI